MNWMALPALERLLRLLGCLFAFVCGASAPLTAQQSPPISGQKTSPNSELEAKQVDLMLDDQPLSVIIAAMSEQIGHGIVMDGKPLQSRGSFKLHSTAKSALDQVAEYFDCNWIMGKSGAILMNKRFHQAGDLPQVHLKEMRQMAADLLSIWPENASKVRMRVYPFVAVPLSPGTALYRTFNNDQLQILNDGKPLTLQNLTVEQKELVRLCILTGTSKNSYDVWAGLNARLAGMRSSYLQWRSFSHNPLDQYPPPLQYSLEYVWPDLQDRGYERLVTAQDLLDAIRKKQK